MKSHVSEADRLKDLDAFLYPVRCELWIRKIHSIVEKRLKERRVKMTLQKLGFFL